MELREQFQDQYADRPNSFAGETPLHQDNAVSINHFLTQAAKEDPLEKERAQVRKREELQLKVHMRNNYNPNKISTRDATSYDNVREMSRYGNLDLSFERRDLVNIDELEESVRQDRRRTRQSGHREDHEKCHGHDSRR